MITIHFFIIEIMCNLFVELKHNNNVKNVIFNQLVYAEPEISLFQFQFRG